jgi:exoribonuclease-2
MNVLFEEAGKYAAGRVLSESDSSAQVELESGRRAKVKAASIVLRFEQPAAAELLAAAQRDAQAVDLDFLWQVAPADDFGFEDLSRDYHGAVASARDKAALLLALHGAPHYFQRRGKGRFRKAPAEQVQAALAAIERRRQEAARIEAMAQQLQQRRLPEAFEGSLYKLLFKPDKNAAEYKALVLACQRAHKGPLELLREAGAIDDPYQFHLQRFFFEWFPKGTGFAALAAPALPEDLPLAPVRAFSIDDSATTEIDDAFSLQWPQADGGDVVVGIHIAAPGAAIRKGDALDAVARARMSTVYMPGGKFTMLPDDVVERYTLAEGRDCAALSLYLTLGADFTVKASRTVLERVPIECNLRHDRLDALVTEEALADAPERQAYPYARELQWLFRYAQHLKRGREQVRGKPERHSRTDYSFSIDDGRVRIVPRRRGAPLDLIVSELMILANCHWGKLLAEHKLPGIYRSQSGVGAAMRTRMGTEPRPHIGLGVEQYTWSTSPLRRYTDLVNQWQIIACATHGRTAALVAPFKPRDAELYAIVSAFESAYKGYAEFQATMERYWTLRYLQQEGIRECEAEVLRSFGGEAAVRLSSLPLVVPVAGAQEHARGTRVKLQIVAMDLITLDVQARLVQVLGDQAGEDAEEGDEDDGAAVVTAVQTAVDVSEAPLEDAEAAAPAP